jgi:hypothetical protein
VLYKNITIIHNTLKYIKNSLIYLRTLDKLPILYPSVEQVAMPNIKMDNVAFFSFKIGTTKKYINDKTA